MTGVQTCALPILSIVAVGSILLYAFDILFMMPVFGFTPWYIINGSSSKLAAALGVDSTFFSSFPSGHTAAAGICYSIMFLPAFIEKLNNKKTRWLFILVPTLITGLVAFSRICVGAHYMSDVLFGGTFAFLSSIIAYLIVCKIYKKKA